MKKTNVGALLLHLLVGQGLTLSVPVLIVFGLGQVHLMQQLGEAQAVTAYGYGAGMVGVGMIVLHPLLGKLADWSPWTGATRRFWLLAGSLVGALGLVGFALASQRPWLYGCWLLLNAGYGLVGTSFAAWLPERLSATELQRVSGWLGATTPVVIMLACLLILGGLANCPMRWRLLSLAALQLAGLGFALRGLDFAPAAVVAGQVLPDGPATPRPTVGYRQYAWVLVGRFFYSLSLSGISFTSLYYVARFGLSHETVLRLNGWLSLGVLLLMGAGWLGNTLSVRWQRQKPLLIVGGLLMGVCQLGLAWSPHLAWTIGFCVLQQLAIGLCSALGLALLNRSLPALTHLGRDIAIVNGAYQAGSVLIHFAAPSLILLGIHWVGGDGYRLYFSLLAGFALVHVLCLLPLQELPRQPRATATGR
ncbi:MFS transporter [Pseudaeromonas sp. ZJS20]|uniref:MFS transporter n=1 Tax=Pseudaeromonas aegiceratis TaxID=3153928 RepID=UPI00390C4DEA